MSDTHIYPFLFGGRYRLILEIFGAEFLLRKIVDGNYKTEGDLTRKGLVEEGQDLGASGGMKTRTNRIYRESTVDSYEPSNHESSQLTDDKMPVLLRGRRRAEGWLMVTSETRMGSTYPTNEKGIKRKVVDRSWIVRKREIYIEIENTFTSDGVWEICDASNNRWVKRKMQLRVRKRTKRSGKRKSSESKMKRSGGERKAEEIDSPRWRDRSSKSCANSPLTFPFSATADAGR